MARGAPTDSPSAFPRAGEVFRLRTERLRIGVGSSKPPVQG